MSYSVENAKDNIRHDMFVRLSPRIRILTWTGYSGSVYRVSFNHHVASVRQEDQDLDSTEGSSVSLSAGQYYYDSENKFLYFRKADSAAPDSTDWIVITYELYLSTIDGYWHRTPTDSASQVVFWNGLITESPSVSRNSSDQMFGFSPVSASPLSFINDAAYFQEDLHESSFNEASAEIYHCAGSLSVANIQKLFTGLCGDIGFTDRSITISLLDKIWKLYSPMGNGDLLDYYAPTTTGPDGTDLDRSSSGQSIRNVYGYAKALRAVCVTSVNDSPTSSNNRDWSFLSLEHGNNTLSATIVSVDTAFIFYVSIANSILFERAYNLGFINLIINGVQEEISAIDTSTGKITTTTTNGAVAAATVNLIPYANIYLITENAWHKLTFGSANDYTLTGIGYDSYGVRLTTTVESSRAISVINPQTDFIMADVLGHNIAPTIGGSPFSHSYSPTAALYHILKTRYGMAESEIDTTAFTAVDAASDINYCSAVIPASLDDQFPSYLDVVSKFLTTQLLRSFIDSDGKFSIKQVGPAATPADLSVTDNDISIVGYSYAGADVASVSFKNLQTGKWVVRSKADITGAAVSGTGPTYDTSYLNESFFPLGFSANASINSYLHKSNRISELDSYFISDNSTSAYLTRLSQVYGDRRCRLICIIKSGAHGLDIGDTVEITREKQPGFEYDGTTENSRKYIVVEIEKQLSQVRLVLDDQKGIEDNTGDW